mmetsp:Transcript_14640/g.33976  ORF Transcript_14640/g.33976 Transcript_14640/m.33976 type:complete len:218 (-) Transcript_14640:271-924(-)
MVFSRENLPMCAALFILLKHSKSDLTCMSEADCLITCDRDVFPSCEEHLDLCGVYLQEDIVRAQILRTGYAMGNINEPRGSFGTRVDQHLKAAMADKPKADSNIYRLFPSKSSKRAELMGRKGLWETHIRTRMAIGFDRNSEPAKLLDKGYDEGGIMVMNTAMKARIKSSMKHMTSDIQRFQSMFAYLMEMTYDLMISSDNAVSKNPGFEHVLGVVN